MNAEQIDIVARYGISKGWHLMPRSVLVEGTSDVSLLKLAADLYQRATGKVLLADLAIVASGEGDRGGASGVVRELIALRGMATAYLSSTGLPVYRVVGLLDSDAAGNNAVKGARGIDSSIIEYRDIFRLRPVMPASGSLDPSSLQRSFENQNTAYKGLTWELEDLVGESLISQYLVMHKTALVREIKVSNAIHREFTREGKSNLVRFCKTDANLEHLKSVVNLLQALRHYLSLPTL